MAVVVDKNEVESTTMKDDGNGSSVRIPSFLIGKRDGDAIKEAIHEMKLPQIKKVSKDKQVEKDLAEHSFDEKEDVNQHESRDFVNSEDTDYNKDGRHYNQTGHQVIMQAIIGGKIGKRDTVNIDLWYNNAYELQSAQW